MNNAVITLKTEAELKDKAMKLADELGFSLSSLINAYLKKLVRTKTVDFSLNEEVLSDWAIKRLEENKNDRKKGNFVSFNTDKEALDYIDKLIKKDENRIRQKISKTVKKDSGKYKETVPQAIGSVFSQSV